ncbi:MAG: 50S ribosomal protein L15 [Cytophagales bacterium]|nr:MAG: 50S ribosomal protein L15 [Cytophagales bacterium]
MNLSNLKPAKGSVRERKRVGRGQGSGMGGTSTRGHKGAQSRSGYSRKVHFEGGQMPLQRRVPKFGFKNPTRVEYKPINLDTLQALFDKTNVAVIDVAVLQQNGLLGKGDLVKVLNRGELTAAVEVHAHAFSASAKEAIEKSGGKAIVPAKFEEGEKN